MRINAGRLLTALAGMGLGLTLTGSCLVSRDA